MRGRGNYLFSSLYSVIWVMNMDSHLTETKFPITVDGNVASFVPTSQADFFSPSVTTISISMGDSGIVFLITFRVGSSVFRVYFPLNKKFRKNLQVL